MLNVYLPIVQMSADIYQLIIIGSLMGILSGLYGTGGGVISVPLMIAAGIPLQFAIQTSALQTLGFAFTNTVKGMASKNVNYRVGFNIALGGIVGVIFSFCFYSVLVRTDYFDIAIYAIYFIIFVSIILYMLFDVIIKDIILGLKPVYSFQNTDNSMRVNFEKEVSHLIKNYKTSDAIVKFDKNTERRKKIKQDKISDSFGIAIGILSVLMGVGGGFMYYPVIMYAFKEKPRTASSTSAMIAFLTTSFILVIQTLQNGCVDVVLAIIVLFFGMFFVDIGRNLSKKINDKCIKLSFILLMMALCGMFCKKIFFIDYAIQVI